MTFEHKFLDVLIVESERLHTGTFPMARCFGIQATLKIDERYASLQGMLIKVCLLTLCFILSDLQDK